MRVWPKAQRVFTCLLARKTVFIFIHELCHKKASFPRCGCQVAGHPREIVHTLLACCCKLWASRQHAKGRPIEWEL
eukprot:5433219-Karenia_brevis.AAC.1